MSSTRRPEHKAPPEIYYNESEARKYTQNSRIIEVQEKCTERALELLSLPEDKVCLLLDLGCGSGLSGEVLTDHGHHWLGLDISSAMLDVAIEREVEGDVAVTDLGQGLPLRAASFDGAVSISALQWLCNADKKSHIPAKRLHKFFSSLFACLCRGSRAVFQFYPENDKQVDLIERQAQLAGFSGGLVIDFPNSSKAKKHFLVLMTGGVDQQVPRGLTQTEEEKTAHNERRNIRKGIQGNKNFKREWILAKKERRKKQGKDVRRNTKYTGRKRPARF